MTPPPGDGGAPDEQRRERTDERSGAGGGPVPSLLAVVSASTAEEDADALAAAVRAWRARGHRVEVAVTDGGHGERGDVRRLRGRSVRVEAADGRPFAMDVDGDLAREVTGVGREVAHEAWTAVVPPG